MKLELSEERLKLHIQGLDSSIRLLGQQLSQSQNGPLSLKNLLPQLVLIDRELDQLDKEIDDNKKVKVEEPLNKGE